MVSTGLPFLLVKTFVIALQITSVLIKFHFLLKAQLLKRRYHVNLHLV